MSADDLMLLLDALVVIASIVLAVGVVAIIYSLYQDYRYYRGLRIARNKAILMALNMA